MLVGEIIRNGGLKSEIFVAFPRSNIHKMSVGRKPFINNVSLQMIALCAFGILFASCIAGDKQAPRVESDIQTLFSGSHVGGYTPVNELGGKFSLKTDPARLPEVRDSVPVSEPLASVSDSLAGNAINNTAPLSSAVKDEPRASTGKVPSLPVDPNELLEDGGPVVDHHQPPKGRKGVLELLDVSTTASTDVTKNETCTCTIVASEGSQLEDCPFCSENKLPVSSVTTNSPNVQNIISATDVPVVPKTPRVLNATNSSSPSNGISSSSEKAVTDPTSVTVSNSSHGKALTEAVEEEVHKPVFTIDDTEEAEHLATSSYPESAYIIPVVAIILTVPLLIALVMILYKTGKEFWERRHYRRMDFLIDGMYND